MIVNGDLPLIEKCPRVLVVGVDPGATEGAACGMLHPVEVGKLRDSFRGLYEWKGGKVTMEAGGLAEVIKTFRRAAGELLKVARAECEGRIMVRVEGAFISVGFDGKPSHPKGVIGPSLSGGIWLSLAFPAASYEIPKPAQWRHWHGFANRTEQAKAQAVDVARLVLGRTLTSHAAEALCMAMIPPTGITVEPNPRVRRRRG